MNNDIAKMLDAVIASRGWSETEAAQAVGTSQPTINRIRNQHNRKIDFIVGSRIVELHAELPISGRPA